METIYYCATSCNYYWGIHGLSELSVWEDIRIYVKEDEKYKQVGSPCVCSKDYFSSSIEELKADYSSDDEWIVKVEKFLKNEETVFHYYYDDPNDEDFAEVPFEAERNENGVKPRSLEMWYPSNTLGKDEIEESVQQFCNKFLGLNNIRVQEKDMVSSDDALKTFIEHEKDMANFSGISISEKVITELSTKTGKTKAEINRLLELSLS